MSSTIGPVDIEFVLKNTNFGQQAAKMKEDIKGVTDYTEQAAKAMTSAMGDFASQSAKQMKESINIQKTVIKDLQQSIKELQNTATNSTGKTKIDATSALGLAKKDLIAEQGALLAMQKQQIAGNGQEEKSQTSLIGGLGKWVIGLASVAAAMKIGKDIIESTEGTAHRFEQGMAAASSATHFFFQSIASGDWSNFWQGLDKAIQGATDYVDVMEKVQNMRNQDKLTTPVVDKQIADAYIEITNKVGKTGEKQLADIDNYLGLIKTKYLPLIETSKASFDALLNKASSGTGGKIEGPEIQKFLEQYRSLEGMLKSGEEYNKQLEDSQALQKEMMRNPQSAPLLLPKYDKAIADLNELGDAGKNAGKKVNEIKLIPFDLRGEIADAGKGYKDLIAAMDGEGKRMQMRRGSLVDVMEKDKQEAAKKATDEANKATKAQLDYETEAGRKLIAGQIEIDQKTLDLQKDSAEKKRQQAELDYRKTLVDLANQKADELKKLNETPAVGGIDKKTGKPTGKYVSTLPEAQQKQLDDKAVLAEALKNKTIGDINEKEAQRIKEIWAEVTDFRLKGIDKEKAAVKDFYDKMEVDTIKTNTKNTPDLLAGITAMRNQKNTEINNKYALQEIDFEQKIETQKNQIQATGFGREAQLMKLNFDTWVKYQNQRIALLEKSNDSKDKQDAQLLQGDIEVANAETKARLQDQILASARQFTGELITQLGLSDQESKQLQGMADIVMNLIKGGPEGYISAAFGGLSLLLSSLNNTKKDDPTTEALNNVNNLLKEQSVILANLSGTNYFQLAAKQMTEYNTAIDLNTQKLKERQFLSAEETKNMNAELAANDKLYAGSNQATLRKYKENDIRSKYAQNADSKNYNTQDFIDAYTKGTINYSPEDVANIQAILEAEKQRAALLQETFRSALGFDSTEVSDSIIQGIQDGLKLADNGLGGFAESFGDKIKKSLVKNISDAMEGTLNAGFMADMTAFLKPESDGGNKLTAAELAQLEKDYAAATSQGSAAYEAIKPILDKYGVGTSATSAAATKGISASATEDTVSAMVGQLTAVRVDIKSILVSMAVSQDDVSKNLLYLKQIANNTSYNKELIPISGKLDNIEKVLRERL